MESKTKSIQFDSIESLYCSRSIDLVRWLMWDNNPILAQSHNPSFSAFLKRPKFYANSLFCWKFFNFSKFLSAHWLFSAKFKVNFILIILIQKSASKKKELKIDRILLSIYFYLSFCSMNKADFLLFKNPIERFFFFWKFH